VFTDRGIGELCNKGWSNSELVCLFFRSIREINFSPARHSFYCLFCTPHEYRLNWVGVVLSSPVTASTQPVDSEHLDVENTNTAPVDTKPVEILDETTVDETTPVASRFDQNVNHAQENNVIPNVSDANHVIEVTKSTNNGVTKGTLLAVSSTSMGRSSRYLSFLNETDM
jgi:hypothetical protein